MKKIITPFLALFVVVACHAQENHLDRFYQKFDTAGAETAKGSINLSLLLNLGGADSSNSWMKKVTMCRFLTLDPAKASKAGQEWAELTQALKDDHFEEWMSVRKGKSNFRVMARDRKDGQEDVVCVAVGENGGGVFFHIRGRFSAADKDRIREMMQDRNDGTGRVINLSGGLGG
ncbi:MAG TPA: DUF4252 domain-containing protein [Puia sp.]|nr:DUF4252 domain-containing protein [Puia sp.]